MKTKRTKKLGKVGRTTRGFELIEFKDRYDAPCSLQMSSLAGHAQPGISAVWLGTDDAKPQVIWHEAAALGVQTTQTSGWVPYPIPKNVSLTTRMHLDRKQVEALVGHLSRWLENGSFA